MGDENLHCVWACAGANAVELDGGRVECEDAHAHVERLLQPTRRCRSCSNSR